MPETEYSILFVSGIFYLTTRIYLRYLIAGFINVSDSIYSMVQLKINSMH